MALMWLYLRKHSITAIVLVVVILLGLVIYGVYSQYPSKSDKIKTADITKGDMDALAEELAGRTQAEEWTMQGSGGSTDNPEPCGYLLNGFNNQFSCSYAMEADFAVSDQSELNGVVEGITKTIANSRTKAFSSPTPEGAQTNPDLSAKPDDVESDADNNETATVKYTVDYKKSRWVACYMTIRYNAHTYERIDDSTLVDEYWVKTALTCLAR
jgi:hypothetical protein